MGEILFDRRAALTIAQPATNSFVRTQPNAIRIENLRMSFKVDKTRVKDPNTCECVVSNLSETTRKQISQRGLKMILEAGYVGTMRQIFIGDIRNATTKRNGPDWETVIQSGDGERAFAYARVTQAIKGPVDAGKLIGELAGKLGVGKGNSARIAQVFAGKQKKFLNGHVARGSVAKELTKVLDLEGYEWSIQDGELQILKPGEALPSISLEISPDTGLIGSPEWNVPDNRPNSKEHKSPFVSFKALLSPELKPGGRVKLVSEAIDGNFAIRRVKHSGDTHGSEWYTEAEVTPL